MDSVVDVQRSYYAATDQELPPILPHGIDPKALRIRLKRRTIFRQTNSIPNRLPPTDPKTTPLPASDLPDGFPEDLAFRGLAAYSLLRTLSVELRLGPFTPNVFLRALHLPFPNRLLGKVHVALLRVLLSSLQMGYHWGDKTNPPLDVVKKRRLDGLKWPLRGGDNLRMLDTYTWPIFYDDYCHLTADVLHASLNDKSNFVEKRNVDVSQIQLDDCSENNDIAQRQNIKTHSNPDRTNKLDVLYLNDSDDTSDYDVVEKFQEADEDDDDDYIERPKKKPRRKSKTFPSSHSKFDQSNKGRKICYNDLSNHSFRTPNCHSVNYTLETTTMSKKYSNENQTTQLLDQQIRHGDATNYLHLKTTSQPSTIGCIPEKQFLVKIEPVSLKRKAVTQTFLNDGFEDTLCSIRNILRPSCHFRTESKTNIGLIPESEEFFSRHYGSQSAQRINPGNSQIRTKDDKTPSMESNSVSQRDVHAGSLSLLGSYTQRAALHCDDTKNDYAEVLSNSNVTSNDDVANMFGEDVDQWQHFTPLLLMRSRIPYHRLSLDLKLCILEYLIDELLSLDSVSDIFSHRQFKTCLSTTPYNKLPTTYELENLENDDECGVCKQEGDLICCDGCASSYHRLCLDLPNADLPEGIWLCPECMLKDPAAFGPLRGGKKCSLDWFTVEDLLKANKPAAINTHAGETSAITTFGKLEEKESTNGYELLVIHGFVFKRPESSSEMKTPIVPLKSSELKELLIHLGSQTCSYWPLAQIPSEPSLFENEQAVTLSPSYFRNDDGRFNPNYYANRYRRAPLPPWIRRYDEASACEYEILCGTATTTMLSSVLTSRMCNDQQIACLLRSSTILFDPYKMITSFLLKLETDLLKASLLDEFWKTKETTVEKKTWNYKTRTSLSVFKLATLLLQLVDATHPRAFAEHWFHIPVSKGKEPEHMKAQSAAIKINDGFIAKHEARRRLWERCPVSALSVVAGKDGMNIESFFRESRPDLGAMLIRKNKRKQLPSTLKSNLERGFLESGVLSVSALNPTISKLSGVMSIEAATGCKRTSRRSDRFSLTRHTNDEIEDGKTELENAVHEEKRRIVSDLVDEVKSDVDQAGHWMLAGRRLFDPIGSLPKSSCRHLGRNGGCIVASFVEYLPTYEVGQVSFSHIWRKRVERVSSFEELLLCMRILESFLDQGIIRKCTILAQKFKGPKPMNPTEILCTQRDVRTGLDYHLVSRVGKNVAQWVSSMTIDLAPLILERCKRRKNRVIILSEKLRMREAIRFKNEMKVREEKRLAEELKRKEELRKREEERKENLRIKNEALKLRAKEMKARDKILREEASRSKAGMNYHRPVNQRPVSAKQSFSPTKTKSPIPLALNVMTDSIVASGVLNKGFISTLPHSNSNVENVHGYVHLNGNNEQETVESQQQKRGSQARRRNSSNNSDGAPPKKRRKSTQKEQNQQQASYIAHLPDLTTMPPEIYDQDFQRTNQHNLAYPSASAADLMTQCPQILLQYLAKARGLIRQYGPLHVPREELDRIRKESEPRLLFILRQGGAKSVDDQVRKLIAIADADALRIESSAANSTNHQEETFRSMEALNSFLMVVITSLQTHNSDLDDKNSKNNTPASKKSLKSSGKHLAAKAKMHVVKQSNKSDVEGYSTSQIIAHHENEVKRLFDVYGARVPLHELERIRKDSEQKLLSAVNIHGLASSPEQVKAILMELESSVFNVDKRKEHNSDRTMEVLADTENLYQDTKWNNSVSKHQTLVPSRNQTSYPSQPTNHVSSTVSGLTLSEHVRTGHKLEIKNLIQNYGAALPQAELHRIRSANATKMQTASLIEGIGNATSESVMSLLMEAEAEVINEVTKEDNSANDSQGQESQCLPSETTGQFVYQNALSLLPQVQHQEDARNNPEYTDPLQSLFDSNEYNAVARFNDQHQLDTRSVARYQPSGNHPEETYHLNSQGSLLQGNQSMGWLSGDVGLRQNQQSVLLSPLAESFFDQCSPQNWQDNRMISSTHQFTDHLQNGLNLTFDPRSIAGSMDFQMGGYSYPQAQPAPLIHASTIPPSLMSFFPPRYDANFNGGNQNEQRYEQFQDHNAFESDIFSRFNNFGNSGGGFQ